MKAVIVDIVAKDAVALNKNGQFIKIKNNGKMMIGSEIDVPVVTVFSIKSFTRVASAAAAFFVVMGLGYGVYSYNSPYSYIDMDINPSVEITANRYNRIIGTDALNSDGEKLISNENFKNKSVKEGIQSLLLKAIEKGYISENPDNAVMLTVSSKDEQKAAEVENSIQKTAEDQLEAVDKTANVVVEKVSLQRHTDALNLNISPGKLLLIEKLQEEDSTIKLEDYKDAPVRQILKKMHEYSKEELNSKDDNDREVSKASENNDGKGNKGDDKSSGNISGSKNNGNSNNNGKGSSYKRDTDSRNKGEVIVSPEQNYREDNSDREIKPKNNQKSGKDSKVTNNSKEKDQKAVKEKNENQSEGDQNNKKNYDSEDKNQKGN